MTKKHFIELANKLKQLKPAGDPPKDIRNPTIAESWEIGRHIQWYSTIEVLADFCYSQNPHFNRGRWLGYINGEFGPNGGSVKK